MISSSIIAICAAGPPNAKHPSLKNTLATSISLSIISFTTSVVRRLQNKYNVKPEKLIASGRSSYQPLVENNSRENRSKNRRTRIILMPNIDKFFALMEAN